MFTKFHQCNHRSETSWWVVISTRSSQMSQVHRTAARPRARQLLVPWRHVVRQGKGPATRSWTSRLPGATWRNYWSIKAARIPLLCVPFVFGWWVYSLVILCHFVCPFSSVAERIQFLECWRGFNRSWTNGGHVQSLVICALMFVRFKLSPKRDMSRRLNQVRTFKNFDVKQNQVNDLGPLQFSLNILSPSMNQLGFLLFGNFPVINGHLKLVKRIIYVINQIKWLPWLLKSWLVIASVVSSPLGIHEPALIRYSFHLWVTND